MTTENRTPRFFILCCWEDEQTGEPIPAACLPITLVEAMETIGMDLDTVVALSPAAQQQFFDDLGDGVPYESAVERAQAGVPVN